MVDVNDSNNGAFEEDDGVLNDADDGGMDVIRRRVGDDICHTHQVIMVTEFTISAFLSIIGSTRILLFIFRSRGNNNKKKTSTVVNRRDSRQVSNSSKKQLKPYDRLVAGLSIGDLGFSAGCMIAPWMAHSNGTAFPTAYGNFTTCAFSGILLLSCAGTVAIYNAALAVNFLRIVVHGWKDDQVRKWVELPAHLIAWIWPLSIMIGAAATQSINPGVTTLVCSFNAYPAFCTSPKHPEIECERGEMFRVFDLAFVATSFVASIVGFSSTIRVYLSYRRTIQQSRRFDFSSDLGQGRKKEEMQELTYQAVLYSLVYLNTMIWPILVLLVALFFYHTPPVRLTTLLLAWFFYPLQGFGNLWVYSRPQARTWRNRAPTMSSFQILVKVFLDKPLPPVPPKPPKASESSETIGSSQNDAFESRMATKQQQAPSSHQPLEHQEEEDEEVDDSYKTAATTESTTHQHIG